ncbi:DUF4331 domain-containing protein [Aquabacterium sp. A7-Y]|nr:DUF4331 domain-containing protein [Aquabacterium sp. A7-Y]MCW7540578.1 DUF4331 domain-containing protein [Aquabacterium sp. A7-Y]
MLPLAATASSHREAPFITTAPKVDATDLYAFRSYEPGRQDYVTLVANYLPLQDGYGGPNYFSLDPNALYEIHIDNNGDAREDLSFQFRFKNSLKNIALAVGGKQVAIPLLQAGAVSGVNPATLNLRETYSIDVVRGDRRSGKRSAVTNTAGGGREFDKPLDFIGTKTFGSVAAYESYVGQHLYTVNIPGCPVPARAFVGQRKDPFVVNLGRTFDLLNLNPLAASGGTDDLADKNVTTLALEIAASCLTAGGDPVIGAWTTASLRQGRLLRSPADPGHQTGASLEGGPWAQVSRLGMPLVNEVVIGLKDKDRFNSSKPKDDGQFADYVTHPTLPALIETLFKDAGVKAPTRFPRQDLVVAFLTGVQGLNKPASGSAAEMLRLNTAIAPTPKGAQKSLGVLAGDNAGFPNGRRPGDDVVDAALRVSMGVLCTLNNPAVFGCSPGDAPSGALALTDGGANVSDAAFGAAFPYLATPIPGAQ